MVRMKWFGRKSQKIYGMEKFDIGRIWGCLRRFFEGVWLFGRATDNDLNY